MFAVIHSEHVARGVHFLPFCEQGCLRTVKVARVIHNVVSGFELSLQKKSVILLGPAWRSRLLLFVWFYKTAEVCILDAG